MNSIFQEDEYIQLAAMHYYIQYGSELSKDNVRQVVLECIPTTRIENKSMDKWIEHITSALSQVDRTLCYVLEAFTYACLNVSKDGLTF